ncbi:hypothetical protein OH77DRAFT_538554 [Trametes cingulata]|nr:hypothetical protein OH77DRAFT_538554 [Trametes cingulata]
MTPSQGVDMGDYDAICKRLSELSGRRGVRSDSEKRELLHIALVCVDERHPLYPSLLDCSLVAAFELWMPEYHVAWTADGRNPSLLSESAQEELQDSSNASASEHAILPIASSTAASPYFTSQTMSPGSCPSATPSFVTLPSPYLSPTVLRASPTVPRGRSGDTSGSSHNTSLVVASSRPSRAVGTDTPMERTLGEGDEIVKDARKPVLCNWNGGCGIWVDPKYLHNHLRGQHKAHIDLLETAGPKVPCHWGPGCNSHPMQVASLARHIRHKHLQLCRVRCSRCGACKRQDSYLANHGPARYCTRGAVAGPSGTVAGPSGTVAGPSGTVAGLPYGAIAGPSGAVAGPSSSRPGSAWSQASSHVVFRAPEAITMPTIPPLPPIPTLPPAGGPVRQRRSQAHRVQVQNRVAYPALVHAPRPLQGRPVLEPSTRLEGLNGPQAGFRGPNWYSAVWEHPPMGQVPPPPMEALPENAAWHVPPAGGQSQAFGADPGCAHFGQLEWYDSAKLPNDENCPPFF